MESSSSWRSRLSDAKPSDTALVTSMRDQVYTRGIPGELNLLSLNSFIKEFNVVERYCPPDNRKSDGEMMTLINTIMLKNTSTRATFEQILMTAQPPLDSYVRVLKSARSMLRTRNTYAQLDGDTTSSSQFGGLPALNAQHITALASISIDPSRIPVVEAIKMAEAIMLQQSAHLVTGVDLLKPGNPDGKGKKGKKGKGGKGSKGITKGGKGKSAITPFQALIPRDADGKVNGWVEGMSPCWCKKAGLDDGKHIFDHCKYDDNGNLKQGAAIAASPPAPAPMGIPVPQDALAASIDKKLLETQEPVVQHGQVAVVTPPENIEDIMSDDAMNSQLHQFFGMSAEQQTVAQQVKSCASNVFTILMWSMAIFILVAATVAGLYVCAFAISGSPSLAQVSGQPEVLNHMVISSTYEDFNLPWLLSKSFTGVSHVAQMSSFNGKYRESSTLSRPYP